MNDDLARLAMRRAGLAALLGQLLLEEPSPSLRPLVEDVDALRPLAAGGPQLASEYERCFLRGVALHESVFRSDDGQQGGAPLTSVVETYERLGFGEHADGRWRVGGVDHLGIELRCYGELCRREAEAWRDDIGDAATSAVETERRFLAAHVSAWIDVALDAAREVVGDGPYRPLVDAAIEFVADEHDRLRPAPALGEPIEVGAPPEHLGPARLARLLLAPDRAGGWLTTTSIGQAAQTIGVPWRPSDTRAALRHVVEAAHEAGELPALLGAIRPVVDGWASCHAERGTRVEGNAAHARAWERRARSMSALLDRIIDAGGLDLPTLSVSETVVVRGSDVGRLADAVDRAVADLRAAGFDVDRR